MGYNYLDKVGLQHLITSIKRLLAGKADSDHTHANATTSAAGLMSADDKSKLDGIAAGANKYTHPAYTAKSSGLYKVTVDGTGHVSAATAVTKADITALGIPGQDTDTTYSTMTGATETADGSEGLVPAATKGSADRYLRSDGTWSTVSGGQKYDVATSSSNGLMSAADKRKLDGIAWNATKNDGSVVGNLKILASKWDTVTVDGVNSFVYTIQSEYIRIDSNQEIIPAINITIEQLNALSKACIVDNGQENGKIYLKALGVKPTIDIPIRIIIRRNDIGIWKDM